MRQALAQAIHHVEHRSAFGRRLVEQPLMKNVVADLALEVEAAVIVLMRLARAYDTVSGDEGERAFARIATAVAKYWVCKRTPGMIYEALECLGGNGYVEESMMPRLYREAPLNAIWEGSGNVMCLDVLRALAREPGALDSLLAEIRAANDPRLTKRVDSILADLDRGPAVEASARRTVGEMARCLQASLLIRHAPAAVADAYVASRLTDERAGVFGELPPGLDLDAIISRSSPHAA
jgi:putative acyl-CoA dehydrogenase